MSDISVVLVGTGGFARHYVLPLIDEGPKKGVCLRGVVDPYPENSPYYGYIQEKNIPIYASLEDFYKKDSADLAVVSSPIHFHCAQVCLALEKGSHVLCEKPVCSIVDDAYTMISARNAAGKKVAIGYQWSHSDTISALKADVSSGILGKPLRMKTLISWPRGKAYFSRSWAAKNRFNGAYVLDSIAMNATAHYIHNMLYIMGETTDSAMYPASIGAELYRANDIESYDTAAFRIRCVNGCDLLYFATHATNKSIGPLCHYEFERATIEYSPETENRFIAHFKDGSVKDYGSPDSGNNVKLWHAVDSARGTCDTLCGIEAALPQLICINGVAENVPVTALPKDRIKFDEENQVIYCDGLSDDLTACYNAWKLPSENKIAYAAPAVYADLRGYKTFKGVMCE